MRFPFRMPLLILSLAVLVGTAPHALAVPADPTLRDLEQEDGTTFKARQWGDEWSHGWETEAGHTIVRDKAGRRWEYARRGADGELEGSAWVVGRDEPPADAGQRVRPERSGRQRRGIVVPAEQVDGVSAPSLAATDGVTLPEKIVPTSGTNKVPAILINFNNTATTNTKAQFDSLLFGTGVYSMKDFYTESSYGQFTVSGGTNGVLGWYTAGNNHDYYGENTTVTVNGYSDNGDAYPGSLVYEAVQAADATTNFAEFDMDGDCYVDVVDIIHQGSGEESSSYGSSTDIWSHSWDLNSAYYWKRSNHGEYTTNDLCVKGGYVKVNKYVIQPERYGSGISTVGVFAHEYGHALGLPDLYDTDYSSQGVGRWSIMAGGSWNYVTVAGDRPAQMDAWSKYYLGWIAPTKLTATAMGTVFNKADTNNNIYQILNGTAKPASGEYFLLENRQKTATTFDAGLPSSGLLVWHIDEVKTSNTGECAPTSAGVCSATHYKVALLQADGLFQLEGNTSSGNSGDPFPGSTNKTSLTGSTTPNDLLYSGASSGFSLMEISASSSAMTANVVFGATTKYSLAVGKNGGSGTVTSSPAGVNCGATCSYQFYNGQVVQLTQVPSAGYLFTGWSGDCSGTGACSVTMTAGRTVTANYYDIPDDCTVLRSTSCYGTIAAAYAVATATDTIYLGSAYAGAAAVTFNRGVTAKLAGGYDAGFSSNSGATSVVGTVTVATGTALLENIVIR